MPAHLQTVEVENYRSLANISLDLEPVNVLFGPNGAGKSTLLDAICFIHDCAVRGVQLARLVRGRGTGLIYDGANDDDLMSLKLATERIRYELRFTFSAGGIESSAGERLISPEGQFLIERWVGASEAEFLNLHSGQHSNIDLRDPEKLSLGRYLDFDAECAEVAELDRMLRFTCYYDSRSFNLRKLKSFSSEAGHESCLSSEGENLWSVLRNLDGRRRLDDRYETVMGYMSEAFPNFDGVIIEPIGPTTVYARFLEKGRRKPILALGISDGHLQLLILLTALFSEGRDRYSLLLIDEPETSLHPWAIAVLAKAIKEATEHWGKQVILATHSPVLLSQFDPQQILSVEQEEGRTRITRLSEIKEVQDLLQEYAPGSLYESEMIGAQSKPVDPLPQGEK